MENKCTQCSGAGMVQTSFGPKPCPTCGGKGFIDDDQSNITSNYRTKSYFEILFYCAVAAGIGYFIWPPAGFFAPIVVFVHLESKYR